MKIYKIRSNIPYLQHLNIKYLSQIKFSLCTNDMKHISVYNEISKAEPILIQADQIKQRVLNF